MDDRRKHPRISYDTAVHVKLYTVYGQADLAGRNLFCTTNDISEMGIRLTIDRDLPVGTSIELRVAIIDPPTAFAHVAEVRWVRAISPERFQIGVEFAGATPQHLDAWTNLVKHIQQLPAAGSKK
jgi:hypothetical protein